ncbi:MAG: type III toxin-antitoxin system ToxN/AbiQ family toxin [Cetobacterium sp.]
MKIIYIKETYIDYLREYDLKVPHNKNEKRPYIGVLFEINRYLYFAPLTSPKPKHKTMSEKIDFIKLRDGELGAINLNNMLPVLESEIIQFDIDGLKKINPKEYNKFIDQVRELNSKKSKIIKNANKLYLKVTVDEIKGYKVKCCDFKLLERMAEIFSKK